MASAVEKRSEHPLATAIVVAASERVLDVPESSDFIAVPGSGATGTTGGVRVAVGNRRLMLEQDISLGEMEAVAERMSSSGRTPVYVAADGEVKGVIAVADRLKPESQAAVEELQAAGIEVVMLTGDNSATARAVASEAGIDHVVAETLPADKAEQVKALQAQGKTVAMVGDGINDAPALVQADVGIAIGTGADVAIESADVALVGGDLRGVSAVIRLSRATMRVIRQNLFWAFAYNVALIPVAAGVLYPVFAGSGVPEALRPCWRVWIPEPNPGSGSDGDKLVERGIELTPAKKVQAINHPTKTRTISEETDETPPIQPQRQRPCNRPGLRHASGRPQAARRNLRTPWRDLLLLRPRMQPRLPTRAGCVSVGREEDSHVNRLLLTPRREKTQT